MAVALLVGCSNGQGGVDNQGTGLVLGSIAGGLVGNQAGKGNVAATVAGAVVGGIVGSEIGKSLDERDRRYAEEAEYDALERGQSGVSRQWRDPDTGHYGDVVPSRPYKRGVADCRDYTHTIYIDGRPKQLRGTACRSSDGSWKSVG
jgi:surface antigen